MFGGGAFSVDGRHLHRLRKIIEYLIGHHFRRVTKGAAEGRRRYLDFKEHHLECEGRRDGKGEGVHSSAADFASLECKCSELQYIMGQKTLSYQTREWVGHKPRNPVTSHDFGK